MDKGAVFYLIEMEEPLLEYSWYAIMKMLFLYTTGTKGEHHVRKSI